MCLWVIHLFNYQYIDCGLTDHSIVESGRVLALFHSNLLFPSSMERWKQVPLKSLLSTY